MNANMKKKISFLFGGVSSEHNASLSSFDNVYSSLQANEPDKERYQNIYYIDRNGLVCWNRCDFTKEPAFYVQSGEDHEPLANAMQMIRQNDEFIFSLLHGQMGEDGHFQGLARVMGIKGTFGSVLSCSLGMSKYHMAQFVSARYPQTELIPTMVITENDLHSLPLKLRPYYNSEIVVKPNSLGASLFTERFVVEPQTIDRIERLISNILRYDTMALVQQYICGKEYSCGCLEINQAVLVLPLVNIQTENNFFGHEEKHKQGKANEVIILDSELEANTHTVKEVAKDLFLNLFYENMCRFDFIVSSDNKVYFLEANPLPGLMKSSIFPKMLRTQNIEVYNLPDIFYENSMRRQCKETSIEYHID